MSESRAGAVWFCNKCGYCGWDDGGTHLRADGLKCAYRASPPLDPSHAQRQAAALEAVEKALAYSMSAFDEIAAGLTTPLKPLCAHHAHLCSTALALIAAAKEKS